MLRIFLVSVVSLLAQTEILFSREQEIEVFTSTPYERQIIYQGLVLFWIGITGLIVIITMKLKELKRVQGMGLDKEEKNVPFLD